MSTLLVASTGGHLKELHHLYERLSGIRGPFRWITFDTPQSRSLLAAETVDFVPFVGGRDPVNIARNLAHAHRALSDPALDTVVSTGSSVALPFFGMARARRLRCHYIESAARMVGPSITGRLMSRIPGVYLYSQYPGWAKGGWRYEGSVFDVFACGAPSRDARGAPSRDAPPRGGAPDRAAPPRLGRLVVSLGTYRGYGFPRLVRRLLEIVPPETEVLWQTGDTDVSDFGIDGHYAIPERDLTDAMREADVVVAHAGVGTALAAFEVGKCPLLVPRRLALGEHVDDHQTEVAGELGGRGLAITIDADDLDYADLLAAAERTVTTLAQAPPFATAGVT